MSKPRPDKYFAFGPFRLDPQQRVLLREGRPVRLSPKAIDTLLVLVERSGQLVDKEELMKLVWPDTFVEEGNLSVNISILRKALGEVGGGQSYIETVPRRGYRFAADVREVSDDSGADLVVSRHTRARLLATTVEEQEPDAQTEAAPTPGQRPLSTAAGWDGSWLGTMVGRRALAASILLAVGFGAVLYFRSPRESVRRAAPGPALKSVAVLPFKALGAGEPENNYLGVGLADALITRLAGVKGVVVRPTSAVLRYAGADHDPLAAGRALNVDAVLDGTVQHAEARIRVTVRLLRVADGVTLWGGSFDEKFTDIFSVQDSIAVQAAQRLELQLKGEERSLLAKHYTDNPEAFRLYIKGRYHWSKRLPEDLNKSVELFNQAIDLDPTFALAYTGLASAYNSIGYQSLVPPKDAYLKAKAAARKALEIDDSLSEAHTSLAWVMLHYDWDLSGGEREFRRAIELNPNYAAAHQSYAFNLLALGRIEEALAESQRAEELDALSLSIRACVTVMLYFARKHDEVIEQCREIYDMSPNFPCVYEGRAFQEKKDFGAAIKAFERTYAASETTENLAWLGQAYAAAGEDAEARKILKTLKEQYAEKYVTPYLLAAIHAQLGEQDEAFELLEKAYAERSDWLIYLRQDPMFVNLRADARYADLLQRIGL